MAVFRAHPHEAPHPEGAEAVARAQPADQVPALVQGDLGQEGQEKGRRQPQRPEGAGYARRAAVKPAGQHHAAAHPHGNGQSHADDLSPGEPFSLPHWGSLPSFPPF